MGFQNSVTDIRSSMNPKDKKQTLELKSMNKQNFTVRQQLLQRYEQVIVTAWFCFYFLPQCRHQSYLISLILTLCLLKLCIGRI